MVHDDLPILRDAEWIIPTRMSAWGWWLTTFVTFMDFLVLARVGPGEEPLIEERYDRLAILSYTIIGLSSALVVLQVSLDRLL